MSDMTRKEAIENLKEKRHELIEFWEDYKHENHEVQALDVAIASLETDEAYQLMEEQPEFCTNCIDREAVLKLFYDYKEQHSEDKKKYPMNYGTLCDMIRWIRELPSVLPKADKPTIIDWNNCHTPEQLESISTTKNDLAVEKTDMIDKSNFSQEQYKTDLQSAYDCGYAQAKNDLGVDVISRQQAIDAFPALLPNMGYNKKAITEILQEVPPVTLQEPRWIPVSERLPEDSGEYFVTVIDEDVETYKHTEIAWYAHPKDYDVEEGDWRELMIDEKVIAWMPLPQPYREVEE